MPLFTRPDAEIHYEVYGSGHPLLLFAPGGLRSQLEFWRVSPSNPGAPPIGGSYCFMLCELAPERVTAAVLQNPPA